jgi:ABC-type multidrug transport system ATPase subunit
MNMEKDLEVGNKNSDITSDISIQFDNLSCYCLLNKRKTNKKMILYELNGKFDAGYLTCIMGSSGSGKTTLLNCISGKLIENDIFTSGNIYINQQNIKTLNPKTRQSWAYVFQDDYILETMTVYEALCMSAQLRLPNSIDMNEKKDKIEQVLEWLDLSGCRDTIVGNSLKRGISGGERKRLAIGMEMITNPSVIFLDEPTSGLDSFTAFSVIEKLKSLTSQNNIHRTIVSTIHQPSSQMFYLFDKLIFLQDGKILYNGDISSVVGYFKGLGFPCPEYTNPADFLFLTVCNKFAVNETEKLHPELIEKRLDIVRNAFSVEEEPIEESLVGAIVPSAIIYKSNFLEQFTFLFYRAFRNSIRNKLLFQVKIIQCVVISVFVGLTYFQIPKRDSMAQIQDRSGVLFFMVLNNVFSSTFGILNVFTAEKQVFVREYISNYYGLPAYFLSKTCVELPFTLLFSFITATAIYFMIGLVNSVSKYFIFSTIMMLTSIIGMSLGIFFASLFDEFTLALSITPLVLLPLMLFSGLYMNVGTIPVYFYWIQYISPMKYAYQATMINEFDGMKLPPPVYNGRIVLEQFGMLKDNLNISDNIMILFGFWISLWVLSYIALLRVTYRFRVKSL